MAHLRMTIFQFANCKRHNQRVNQQIQTLRDDLVDFLRRDLIGGQRHQVLRLFFVAR